jgi:ABC-type nitrate/sulfonate/bicarbonate transport system substrate-binding protein
MHMKKTSLLGFSVQTRTEPLRLGFVPVNDCAPLVVAQELGFFSKYELKVELKRQKSWADIRDKIADGRLTAAQAPATLPLMMSLGLNSEPVACVAGMAMSLSSSAITVSRKLWLEGLHNHRNLRPQVLKRKSRLCFGVPYQSSAQDFLLRRWLKSAELDPDLNVRIIVVPPAQMFPMLKLGYIDGYCVDEPWNSVAVQAGVGLCVATSLQLTPLHPEKVLMVREKFACERADEHRRLIAALLDASDFCDRPWNRKALVTLLADSRFVDASKECLLPGFVGPFGSWDGRNQHPVGTGIFSRFAACELQPEKIDWIGRQLSLSPPAGYRLVQNHLASFARLVYRRDIFRGAEKLAKAHARSPMRRSVLTAAKEQASLAA